VDGKSNSLVVLPCSPAMDEGDLGHIEATLLGTGEDLENADGVCNLNSSDESLSPFTVIESLSPSTIMNNLANLAEISLH
jgi:hypothetical protein